MKQNLIDFQNTESEDEADIIIVNSCTVTNGADTAVRSYVRKMSRSGKKVLFTGCGVKNEGKSLYDKDLVYLAFGHSKKEQINDFLKKDVRFYHSETPLNDHLDKTIVRDFIGKSRAFLKIQEGCNFKCSYCIIPSVRGVSRSYESSKIIDEIRSLVDSGIKEVVLTGTNVGSYGRDKEGDISGLILRISQIRGLKRVRIGSLEPSQIDERFLELLDLDVLEKHLHIALQHTHDKMLAFMNRINRFKRDKILLDKIAQKGFAIGTDLIIGHPGESEEIYQAGLANIKDLPLTHVHPFIYSKRDGTKSASMPQAISQKNAKKRLHEIRDVIAQKNMDFRSQNKQKLFVLIEKSEPQEDGSKLYSGLDQFFNKIKIKSKKPLQNSWLEISNYQIYSDTNYAEI